MTDAGVEPMGGAEGVTGGTAMRPSKRPMAHGTALVQLPAGMLTLVVAGSASLFATFWDDAWHTDLGRDQTTIPPHLLLCGSMAVIGAVVVAWGVSALGRGRSVAAVWRQPPLLLAAAGGTVTLAALPIDAAWHAAFGGDAVLWSPRTCSACSAARPDGGLSCRRAARHPPWS